MCMCKPKILTTATSRAMVIVKRQSGIHSYYSAVISHDMARNGITCMTPAPL
uniref:Uncharacterized protein n=1 Tax=Anguilla anguilla TaxID=7936 RepID=A0A0E9R7B8_ANGAN